MEIDDSIAIGESDKRGQVYDDMLEERKHDEMVSST